MPLRRPVLWLPLLLFLVSPCFAQTPPAVTGDSLFTRNRFEMAQAAYQREAKSKPDSPAPRIGLMRSLLRLDRWDRAIIEGKTATARSPKNADLAGLYALALFRGGQPDEAKIVARSALARDEKSYWAVVATGTIAGAWDEDERKACALFRRATSQRPNAPEGWLGLVTWARLPMNEYKREVHRYLSLRPQGYPHRYETKVLESELALVDSLSRSFGKQKLFQILSRPAGGVPLNVSVPVEWERRRVVVLTSIDGKPVRLLLDTGGAYVTLYPKVASRFGSAPIIGKTIISGANGMETGDLIKANVLRLGELSFGPVVVNVAKEIGTDRDGELGSRVFSDLVLTLDKGAKRMIMSRSADAGFLVSSPASDAAAGVLQRLTVPFHPFHHFILLRLRVNGTPVWADLDTGATFSLCSLRVARSLAAGLSKEEVASMKVRKRFGYGVSAPAFTLMAFNRTLNVSFDGINIQQAGIEFAPGVGASMQDDSISPCLGFEIGMSLGMDFVEKFDRIIVDYPNHQVTFVRTVKPSSPAKSPMREEMPSKEAPHISPPFKLPDGYHWSLEQARFVARNNPSDNTQDRIVAATDSTRLPPQEAPKGYHWVWLVNHWLLLPDGATIQTTLPLSSVSLPAPPDGYARFFFPADGAVKVTTPETVKAPDFPILTGKLQTDGWIFVPRTSETQADGTVIVR